MLTQFPIVKSRASSAPLLAFKLERKKGNGGVTDRANVVSIAVLVLHQQEVYTSNTLGCVQSFYHGYRYVC